MNCSTAAFIGQPLPLRASSVVALSHRAATTPLCASSSPIKRVPSNLALSRRAALSLGAALAASAVLSPLCSHAADVPSPSPTPSSPPENKADVPFLLPPLPYSYNALEPAIDRETMVLHHDKHFAKYTAGVNAALAKLGPAGRLGGDPAALAALLAGLDEATTDAGLKRALRNNGGGYLNHYQFFATLAAPDKERAKVGPNGDLSDEIKAVFGGFDEFRASFDAACMELFGSGFVYLVKDISNGGKLAIKSYPNQDSPVFENNVPVLGCDLWEHAYYRLYGPNRAGYITAWWTVVNWPIVSSGYLSPSKAPSALAKTATGEVAKAYK
jgi:superoxide dismutase, Fe-Mn family